MLPFLRGKTITFSFLFLPKFPRQSKQILTKLQFFIGRISNNIVRLAETMPLTDAPNQLLHNNLSCTEY